MIIHAFSCVVLLHHDFHPSLLWVCVCVPASKPCHHTAALSHVPVISLCLCPPPSPTPPHHPPRHLPLFSDLRTQCFPLEVFRCLTPPHASRNGRVTQSNQERGAVCSRLIYSPICLLCHLRNMLLRFTKNEKEQIGCFTSCGIKLYRGR